MSKLILRVAVSVVGLALAWRQIDVGKVTAMFQEAELSWLLIAAALVVLGVVIRAWRWYAILGASSSGIGFMRLVWIYFVTNLLSAVLPTGIGGDAVRVAEISSGRGVTAATASVILDRYFGLATLALGALPLLVIYGSELTGGAVVASVVVMVGILVSAAILAFWSEPASRLLKGMKPRLAQSLGGLLREMGEIFVARWQTGALISIIFNVTQIAYWWAGGRALGVELELAPLGAAVLFLALSILVPSIGGLGVREAVAPALLGLAGASADQAVSLSLLIFVLQRAVGVIGLPGYLLGSDKEKEPNGLDEHVDQ